MKSITRIVAVLLVPCLIAEPSAAVVRRAFCAARHHDALRDTDCALPAVLFANQALALPSGVVPGPAGVRLDNKISQIFDEMEDPAAAAVSESAVEVLPRPMRSDAGHATPEEVIHELTAAPLQQVGEGWEKVVYASPHWVIKRQRTLVEGTVIVFTTKFLKSLLGNLPKRWRKPLAAQYEELVQTKQSNRIIANLWKTGLRISCVYLMIIPRGMWASSESTRAYLNHRTSMRNGYRIAQMHLSDTDMIPMSLPLFPVQVRVKGWPWRLTVTEATEKVECNLGDKLRDLVHRGQCQQAEVWLLRYIEFQLALCERGAFNKDFGFANYGVVNQRLVLLDFGQLTDKLNEVLPFIQSTENMEKNERRMNLDAIFSAAPTLRDGFRTRWHEVMKPEQISAHWGRLDQNTTAVKPDEFDFVKTEETQIKKISVASGPGAPAGFRYKSDERESYDRAIKNGNATEAKRIATQEVPRSPGEKALLATTLGGMKEALKRFVNHGNLDRAAHELLIAYARGRDAYLAAHGPRVLVNREWVPMADRYKKALETLYLDMSLAMLKELVKALQGPVSTEQIETLLAGLEEAAYEAAVRVHIAHNTKNYYGTSPLGMLDRKSAEMPEASGVLPEEQGQPAARRRIRQRGENDIVTLRLIPEVDELLEEQTHFSGWLSNLLTTAIHSVDLGTLRILNIRKKMGKESSRLRTTRIDPAVHEELKSAARQSLVSKNALVNSLLREYLTKHDASPAAGPAKTLQVMQEAARQIKSLHASAFLQILKHIEESTEAQQLSITVNSILTGRILNVGLESRWDTTDLLAADNLVTFLRSFGVDIVGISPQVSDHPPIGHIKGIVQDLDSLFTANYFHVVVAIGLFQPNYAALIAIKIKEPKDLDERLPNFYRQALAEIHGVLRSDGIFITRMGENPEFLKLAEEAGVKVIHLPSEYLFIPNKSARNALAEKAA